MNDPGAEPEPNPRPGQGWNRVTGAGDAGIGANVEGTGNVDARLINCVARSARISFEYRYFGYGSVFAALHTCS